MNPLPHGVHDALHREHYPIDREGVFRAVGDVTIFDATGSPIAVRDLLARSDQLEFATPEEVLDAIERCIGRA